MLKTIPFNPGWANQTKEDFHAMYLRRKQDNWGAPIFDEHGMEQWDAVCLPMRRHDDHEKKGFKYLTVAITSDDARWPKVAGWIRDQTGEDPFSYIQDRRSRSTFSVDVWASGQIAQQQDQLAQLKALVEKYGVDAVLDMKRMENPAYELPAALLATAGQAAEPKGRKVVKGHEGATA